MAADLGCSGCGFADANVGRISGQEHTLTWRWTQPLGAASVKLLGLIKSEGQ